MSKGSSPTSCEILSESHEIYPRTLEEIEQSHGQEFQHNKTLEMRQTQVLPSLLANSNRGALTSVMTPFQLHSKLPDLGQDSKIDHDIYLCAVPYMLKGPSFVHWSIFSQGCFSHLRNKVDTKMDVSESLSLTELDAMLEVIKKDVALGRLHRRKSQRVFPRNMDARDFTPLLAVHVGQTRFDEKQITKVGHWVMAQISRYNLFSENCHFFALTLLWKIIMTKRDGTIFVGTRAQIANWDLRLKTQKEYPYSQELGFLVSKPEDEVVNGISFEPARWFQNPAAIQRGIQSLTTCDYISRLYRYGPLGNAACDPSGASSQVTYTLKLFKDNMGSSSRIMMDGVRESVGKLWSGSSQGKSSGHSDTSMAVYRSELDRLRQGSESALPAVEYYRKKLGISKAEQEKILWEMDRWDTDEHGTDEQRTGEGGWGEEELRELAMEQQAG